MAETARHYSWKRRRAAKRAARSGVLHGVLVLGGIVFSLPFVWLITTSFKRPEEVFVQPIQWIPSVWLERPVVFVELFRNYFNAAEFIPFWLWIRNTLYITSLSVVLTVFSCSLVAYGFSRIRWRGRDIVFVFVLATMMLPQQVTMIPVFLIFNKLGWYNTLKPLWAPAIFGNAFSIFLLRQFMMTIPTDLEDSAKIDGCGHFRIYRTVVMPLIKPALAVIAIRTFQGAWNNFLGPYIYINSKELMPIALGLQWFKQEHMAYYGEMTATSLVMTAPIILIFFFCQRYMIQGITLTGMKQ
jgi:multiple sugar transport system permease protein